MSAESSGSEPGWALSLTSERGDTKGGDSPSPKISPSRPFEESSSYSHICQRRLQNNKLQHMPAIRQKTPAKS